jgi:hypothetical protein
VCLPFVKTDPGNRGGQELPDELAAYMAQWRILVAMPPRRQAPLVNRLHTRGIRAEHVDDVMSALARVEGQEGLDAVVIDRPLLRQEAPALLKAVLRLRPSLGLVVLSENPEADAKGLADDVVFLPADAEPDSILVSLIEARTLAMRRQSRERLTPVTR